MLQAIQDLLSDTDLLVQKVEDADENTCKCSICISWSPFIKWNNTEHVDDEAAFVLMLSKWLKIQNDYCSHIKPDNKGKSPRELLSELFGTSVFSEVELKVITDNTIFQNLEYALISDHDNEMRRKKELKSMKKASGLIIKCKTGDILYFGRTKQFLFLVSMESAKRWFAPPARNDIHEILFADNMNEIVRKRPGMFIGSLSIRGFYVMLFGLIEELLSNAVEKIISVKLRPQDIIEITCESYSVQSNTYFPSNLAIVSALSEYFEYQDDKQNFRTEQGLLVSSGEEHVVDSGTKLVWRPDHTIFEHIEFDYCLIIDRMIELASLYPYTIYLSDDENHNKIYIPSGIKKLIKHDCFSFGASNIITVDVVSDHFVLHAAISFSAISAEIRKSYVNTHMTPDGGTHVDGVLSGVGRALKRILASYDHSVTPANIIKHMNYVVHIQIENPRFAGAVRRALKNIEVKPVIQKQVEEQFYDSLIQNVKPLKTIYPGLF